MTMAICKNCRMLFEPRITPTRFGAPLLCSWHPGELQDAGNTGPAGDYADMFIWSCCGAHVIGPIVEEIVNGRPTHTDRKPPRSPGCHQGPHVPDEGLALADELSDVFESIKMRLDVIEKLERSGVDGEGIFISYSHRDKGFVDRLTARFAVDRIKFWRDEKDIIVGDVIDKAISDGIQNYCLFLTVLTPSSIISKWVERELDEAVHEVTEKGKIILPIIANGLRTDDIPRRIRRFKCADFNADFDSAYDNLLRSVRAHIERNR